MTDVTDDTVTPVDIDTDDLDTFSNELFGNAQDKIEADTTDDDDEDQEVDDLGEDDLPANDEDEDEDEGEEPEPRKRNSAKERIDGLLAKNREADRRNAELLRRLETLEASVKKSEPEGVRDMLPTGAPNPDAKAKDGEPLYPLGEYDPQFIADLSKFTVQEEFKAAKERADQEEYQQKLDVAKQELANTWIERLDKYEETQPDIRENIRDLTDTFVDLDPGYGEYLAMTLMGADNGPAIMEYLSSNIGEAKRIVDLGPAAATFAIGRLDARFTPKTEEKQNKKQSAAPPPPEKQSRGSHGQFSVNADTDDQEAFERLLFNKKR